MADADKTKAEQAARRIADWLARDEETFKRPLGGVKGVEALRCSPPPADRAMILLNYLVKIFYPTQFERAASAR